MKPPSILALLLLFGCSATPSAVYLSFPNAPPTAYAAAQEAVDQWNKACPDVSVHLSPDAPEEGDVEVVLVPAESLELGRTGVLRRNYEGRGVKIEIDERFATQPWIYAHETGHALGIRKHTESGIMAAAVSAGTEVRPSDCPK
jgi:hypothetical protein